MLTQIKTKSQMVEVLQKVSFSKRSLRKEFGLYVIIWHIFQIDLPLDPPMGFGHILTDWQIFVLSKPISVVEIHWGFW